MGHITPVGELFPESAHDQQRVVDARTEAEHHRDRRRELGQAEGLGEDREDHLADQDAGQGSEERHRHGGSGTEQQQQEQEGDEDSDQLADRGFLLGGEVDGLAAELDGQGRTLGGTGHLL